MKQLTPAAKAAAQAVLDGAARRLYDEGYRRAEDGRLLSPYDFENYELRAEMPHEQWRAATLEAIAREDRKRRENPERFYPQAA